MKIDSYPTYDQESLIYPFQFLTLYSVLQVSTYKPVYDVISLMVTPNVRNSGSVVDCQVVEDRHLVSQLVESLTSIVAYKIYVSRAIVKKNMDKLLKVRGYYEEDFYYFEGHTSDVKDVLKLFSGCVLEKTDVQKIKKINQ
jgi:hypothetical protein